MNLMFVEEIAAARRILSWELNESFVEEVGGVSQNSRNRSGEVFESQGRLFRLPWPYVQDSQRIASLTGCGCLLGDQMSPNLGVMYYDSY